MNQDIKWTAAEHSIMIYLLGAIVLSPRKIRELCKVVEKNTRSPRFMNYLQRLQLSYDLNSILEIAENIRNELR